MQEYLLFVQNHPFLTGGFFAILAMIIWTEFSRITQKFGDISSQEVVKILNDGPSLLIDVRDSNELKDGVIKGAKHIPLGEFAKRIPNLEADKDKSIVIYCRSGNRSQHACRQLTKHDFLKVYNLKGGIMAWQSDNLPLAKR